MKNCYLLLACFAACLFLFAKPLPDTGRPAIFSSAISPNSLLLDEELSTTEELGRQLFYEKLLSANNEISCATCHQQAFSFGGNQPLGVGIGGALTYRNVPNINDMALLDDRGPENPHLFWDGREPDLESLVLQPVAHKGEMGKDLQFLPIKLMESGHLDSFFEEAFGSPGIDLERISVALAAFVRSLTTSQSLYDLSEEGLVELTAPQKEGKILFFNHCEMCHRAPLFSLPYPSNNGLDAIYEDTGVASWSGQEWDIGKFKPPSLRNAAVTAPYMHDGRFAVLEEMIDFYSEGVQPHPNSFFKEHFGQNFTGFHFSEQKKQALKAFLLMLTDEDLLTNPKWSDPFEPPTGATFLSLEEKTAIFPNPFSETATVQIENPNGEWYELRLTDLRGRVLKTIRTRQGTTLLKKGNLTPGIYLLEIKKGERKKMERIILK